MHGIDLTVEEGEIVTLLGANGAGKSTTLRAISGLLRTPPAASSSRAAVLGQRPDAIVRARHLARPRGPPIFPGLTVRENIMLGASNRSRPLARDRAARGRDVRAFPRPAPAVDALGWTLSGGQLQMVAVARGLMAQPRLLLLDEPSLGLAPLIVQQVFRIIADIRARGTTVLLVEQNARIGLSVADRAYVLETGRLALTGTPEALWPTTASAPLTSVERGRCNPLCLP